MRLWKGSPMSFLALLDSTATCTEISTSQSPLSLLLAVQMISVHFREINCAY